MTHLANNMSGIVTQIDKIKNVAGTPMNDILTGIDATLVSISQVPTGTAAGLATIAYATGFL